MGVLTDELVHGTAGSRFGRQTSTCAWCHGEVRTDTVTPFGRCFLWSSLKPSVTVRFIPQAGDSANRDTDTSGMVCRCR